jgi:gas vesicle protein
LKGEFEMADNNGDLGSFLAGFVIGGLIGAGVALLMAPQSGEETRAIIKEKSIELRDRAVDTVEEAQKQVEEMQERGKQVYEEQVQRVQAAVDAGKKAIKKSPGESEA